MTFIRMLRPAVLMFLICLCGAVVPLHAQNTVNLNGRVTDNNGQPLAGAQIVARNQETNQQRGAITRSDGSYSLVGLTPGTYTVTQVMLGYAP